MTKQPTSASSGVRVICGCLLASAVFLTVVPQAGAQSQQDIPGLVESGAPPGAGQMNYMDPNSYPQTLGGGQAAINNQLPNYPYAPQSQNQQPNQQHQQHGQSNRGSGLGFSRLGTGLLGSMGMMGMMGMMGRGGGGGGRNSGNNSSSSLAARNPSSNAGAGGYSTPGSPNNAQSYREMWWSQHGRQAPTTTVPTTTVPTN